MFTLTALIRAAVAQRTLYKCAENVRPTHGSMRQACISFRPVAHTLAERQLSMCAIEHAGRCACTSRVARMRKRFDGTPAHPTQCTDNTHRYNELAMPSSTFELVLAWSTAGGCRTLPPTARSRWHGQCALGGGLGMEVGSL
jgi:hypothetical protein